MHLVLGTAQFGLPYGVAGRGRPVPEDEVRFILRRAWELGIRVLDTAAAYGDIEQRLCGLAGDLPFQIVTKMPAVPTELEGGVALAWVARALMQASRRLGNRLNCVLFHRAEDLLRTDAGDLWSTCADWADGRACRLGVSCYEPAMLVRILQDFPLAVAQLPANAFDQRLRTVFDRPRPEVEIHLRSAFLQGLLLMPEHEASRKLPAAAEPLARWHRWISERGLERLHAALGVVKALPASHCVVGVDDIEQLEAIAEAWNQAAPLEAPYLAVQDLSVIDPRKWPQTS